MKRILPAIAAATLILAPLIRADDSTATSTTPSTATAPAAPASLDSSATISAPADLKAQRHAEMIKRFDTNGDGILDANERAAMRAAMQQKRADRMSRMNERMLKKYDKNGDGMLDSSEQATALADLETRPRFIARFDKDGDGKLNDVEKANAENAMRALWSRQQSTAAATPTAPAAGTP